jgi:hypothetical protein
MLGPATSSYELLLAGETDISSEYFGNVLGDASEPFVGPMWLNLENDGRVPMAYTCNPSYSGDRDQEDHGLRLAWANNS